MNTNASVLGYNQLEVIKYYEPQFYTHYTSMVSCANIEHTNLYSTSRSLKGTANGLASNKYTKSAAANLYAQAEQMEKQAKDAENKAKQKVEILKMEYQSKVDNLKQNWNNSKIVFCTINGQSHFYQVPYMSGLNFVKNNIELNYMGKIYPLTAVTYDEAIIVQPKDEWETFMSNSNSVHINNGTVIGNNIYVSGNSNSVVANEDGDVVFGQTIIGDKVTNTVITGNGNVVGNNNVLSTSFGNDFDDDYFDRSIRGMDFDW